MKIGDRVSRLEDRQIKGATIIEIDGENALISYDEGGEGWWPISSLAKEQ